MGLTSGLLKLVMLVLVSFQWWRDVVREARLMGQHTSIVELGLRWGIILFIISEWPPLGILAFSPFGVPLLNTVVLLSSGVRVTWAHHRIIRNNHNQALVSLAITVVLGIYFTILQGAEYLEASFTFADSVYGSSFFLATGFHGFHVLIGTAFLLVCLIRLTKFNLNKAHHFGFEAAA
ncbi:hypothetical protein DAPPUDRAFT_123676 [Daphnia pulex]|uniref:Cytochrome c oxidase subunit 3 n=1 Tax=Daphnia pulex TaxID=6669 RepID=E9I606_DAPPU|nr:hypothetical protein DAPPUDRAFT_123676 [Daphnia pulex]|eukprot:EFX60574.1 hypothetical protein DAPPUDRAFT_123676 [Daphnia pulex]